MNWDGVDLNGLEWNGVGWNGQEWIGTDWCGSGWSGLESIPSELFVTTRVYKFLEP